MRTNCNNCGAVLVDGLCEHCKTRWFAPGFQFGNGVLLKSVTVDCSPYQNYEISMVLVGVSRAGMQQLGEAIQNAFNLGGE